MTTKPSTVPHHCGPDCADMKFDRKSGRLLEVKRERPIGARIVDQQKFTECLQRSEDRDLEASPTLAFVTGLYLGAMCVLGLGSLIYILYRIFA